MTYLSDRHKKRGLLAKYFAFIVPILILIFFWSSIKIIFSAPAFAVSNNIWKAKENFKETYREFKSYFSTKELYLKHIEDLEKENDALLTEIAMLEGEIEVASDLLNVEFMEEGNVILAYPIFTSLDNIYESFLISRGFTDGIEQGMIVYAAGNKPIGIIEEVGSKNSKVSLLSKGGNTIFGIIRDRSISLQLTGIGGGDFTANMPKDSKIEIGDVIFWKDRPSMELGQVIEVENEPQSISKTVFVKGNYNVSGSTRLYINIK